VGRKTGLTEAKLRALPQFETSPEFTEFEKLALQYAVEMTRTSVEIPEELLDGLRKQLNDAQLVELTSAIAWENYRARFNHALGMESEGFSKNRYCPLPEPGTLGGSPSR
jgi:alkylhydroperoxidase family enzyme